MSAAISPLVSSSAAAAAARKAAIVEAVAQAEEAAKAAKASSEEATAAVATVAAGTPQAAAATAAAAEAATAATAAEAAAEDARTEAAKTSIPTQVLQAAAKAAKASEEAAQKAAKIAVDIAAAATAATAATASSALSSPSSAATSTAASSVVPAAALSSSAAAPSPAAAPKVDYFTNSWESTSSSWYNIMDMSNDTDVKTIIGYQKKINTADLVTRPKNGAILSLDVAADKVVYFDYSNFKKDKTEEGSSDIMKKADLRTTLKINRDTTQKDNIPVVSLLSKGDTLIGICFSKCSSSDIDGPYMGNLSDVKDRVTAVKNKLSTKVSTFFGSARSSVIQPIDEDAKKRLEKDTRLICGKNAQSGTGVKILFFNNRLNYVFFSGTVNFDNNGNFIGLVDGSLLRKVKDDVYEVLTGKFQGTMVNADPSNKFYQYSYNTTATITNVSAIGYAAGDVGWNFQNPFPLNTIAKPDITFLNWNFGPVKVEKKKVPYGDHGGSSCSTMYYTSYSIKTNINGQLQKLMYDAFTSVVTLLTESKIEFIKKEEYTDFYHKEPVTLLQLKFEVAIGVFCIIELTSFGKDQAHRVRIYKTYNQAITPFSEQPDRKIKKHGLFIGLDTKDSYSIQFVSFYEVDERGDTTGITYNTAIDEKSKTKNKKIDTHLSTYNNRFMSGKMKNTYDPDDKFRDIDDFTKKSFDYSLDAAVVSFDLFLNKDGLVSILQKYLEPAAAATPSITPQDSVKGDLHKEVEAMKSTLDSELKKAMNFVENVEMSESYYGSVKTSIFSGFFNKSPTAGSAVAPSLPAAAPASPISITLTKYIDDGTTFILANETLLKSILHGSIGSYSYKISNDSIADVTDTTTSEVTLKSPGTTTITVYDSHADNIATINLTVEQSRPSGAAAAPAPVLEEGGIAMYVKTKVYVQTINGNKSTVNFRGASKFDVPTNDLTPFMSKAEVDNSGKNIDQLLAGGKGRGRRSTRKYQKRRGRGNGNNGRRRLTRKVKGQSGGGGGGGGGARRGGKIHRKTKKNVRRGRGGRRGHRRTIKKYHRR
jgi:hypothetical protein